MSSRRVRIVVLNWIFVIVCICCVCSIPVKHSNGGLSSCDVVVGVAGNQVMECNVKKGETFDYRKVREWSEKEKDQKYVLRVICDGGNVFLPWPFKARNILALEVHGCAVSGFLSEMTLVQAIPDELKTLVLSNISIEIPFEDMVSVNSNANKVPWETDCGQMSIEKLILRNIHYDIKMSPEERDNNVHNVLRFGIEGSSQHVVTKPCVYHSLRYVDESGSRKTGHYHLRLLPEYSEFPKLEVYNMSNNNIGHVPRGFRHLHSKKFPVLKHLDFSNNALSEFEFEFPKHLKSCSIKIIDLKHNHITSVPLKSTEQLRNIGTIFVDLRHNPLRCNCRLAAFREYLQTQYQNTTDIKQREQFSNITCNNGPLINGKLPEISLLDVTFDKKCKR